MQIDLNRDLSKNCLKDLLEISRCQLFKKGETIFFENDFCENIYFILEGTVILYKDSMDGRRKTMYILGENHFLNENDIYHNSKKISISCDAFTNVKMLLIPQNKMKDLILKHQELAVFIIQSLSHKTKRLYRQLKNTTTISMDKRIASKLWKLARDYGYEYGDYHGFSIKINNTYLADMIGTNRETVSRGIKKFKEMGLVKIENGKFFILKDKLKKFYEE